MKNMNKQVLVVAVCLLLLSTSSVFAVPTLQLDASDGVYLGGAEESIMTTGNIFTLYALVKPTLDTSGEFYISASLTPRIDKAESDLDYGSFTFAGETIKVTEDMTYGNAPINVANSDDLPSHGIFPTYFKEFEFDLVSKVEVPAYNVQDDSVASGKLYSVAFDVDISGLTGPDIGIHFDLYTKNDDGTIDEFAPFSHDVTAVHVPVPVPGAFLLGGIGVSVVGWIKRRRML